MKTLKIGDKIQVTNIINHSWQSKQGMSNCFVLGFRFGCVDLLINDESYPLNYMNRLNSGLYSFSSYNIIKL